MKEQALKYHSDERKGKIQVLPTKPCRDQKDLSLAYSPGVAWPVMEIATDPGNAYKYTTKGNLVAVISNGSAILGLGNLGAIAAKPVMEGKGTLFKRFADVDVFDLEVGSENPDDIIKVCKLVEPTFGGINLEDIKAPECFYIEAELKKSMNIPVFHDDQHGTAIITGAGLINALNLAGKNIGDVRIIINGAGAAGIACAHFFILQGAKKENIILCDSRGVIYKGREGKLTKEKEYYAAETDARNLADALAGSDVFIGLSVADVVSPEMLNSMSKNPIVFAMANPDPEIKYETALKTRDDVIMATGRSDYPNQVNNVLGFPYIFRGALDVHASAINDEMKLAAANALASLPKKDFKGDTSMVFGPEPLAYGKEYIVPKPFDPRLLPIVSLEVARAAMETGVARVKMDLDDYRLKLEETARKLNNLPEDFDFSI